MRQGWSEIGKRPPARSEDKKSNRVSMARAGQGAAASCVEDGVQQPRHQHAGLRLTVLTPKQTHKVEGKKGETKKPPRKTPQYPPFPPTHPPLSIDIFISRKTDKSSSPWSQINSVINNNVRAAWPARRKRHLARRQATGAVTLPARLRRPRRRPCKCSPVPGRRSSCPWCTELGVLLWGFRGRSMTRI